MPANIADDPFTRRLAQITRTAQAESGQMNLDLPEVDVPPMFEAIKKESDATLNTRLAEIEQSSLQRRQFKAGITSNREIMAVQSETTRREANLLAATSEVMSQREGYIRDIAAIEQQGAQQRAGIGAQGEVDLTNIAATGSEQRENIAAQGVQDKQLQALVTSGQLSVVEAQGIEQRRAIALQGGEERLTVAAQGEQNRQTQAPALQLQREIATGNVQTSAATSEAEIADVVRTDPGKAKQALLAIWGEDAQNVNDPQAIARMLASSISQGDNAAKNLATLQRITGVGFAKTVESQRLEAETAAENKRIDAIFAGLKIQGDQLLFDRDKFSEAIRQFDVTTTEGMRQFNDSLATTVSEGKLNRDQAAQLAERSLGETSRQFDLSRGDGLAQYAQSIKETARQFDLSQEQQVTLASNALAEGARQFDLSSDQSADQFSANLAEMTRQFGLSQAQEKELAIAGLNANLAINEAQINVQTVANAVQLLTGFQGEVPLSQDDIDGIVTFVLGSRDAVNMAGISDTARTMASAFAAHPEASRAANTIPMPAGGADETWFQQITDALPGMDNGTKQQILAELDLNGDGNVDQSDFVYFSILT